MGNELATMLNGNSNRIDPHVPMEYRTEFLSYDEKWELAGKRLGLLFLNLE